MPRPIKDVTVHKHCWVVEFVNVVEQNGNNLAISVRAKSRAEAIALATTDPEAKSLHYSNIRTSRVT